MRRHKGDVWIAVLTLMLMALGLIVIYAIGPLRVNFMNAIYGTSQNTNSFFIRQGISVAMAIVAFVIAYKMPFERVQKMAKWMMVAGLAACALLAILALAKSGLARCELGACRWYKIGAVGFQPAELLKLGLVLYLAQLMSRRREEGMLENSSDFWIPFATVSGFALFFVVGLQKDLGTGVTIMGIIMAMLFAVGLSWRKFGLILGALLLAGVGMILLSPHRLERLKTFSGGEGSNSYHVYNAMIAIGSGGLAGVGIGNSVQATGYLPESINDSVFAVMGETFGFLGLGVVLGLFYFLLMRLMKVAERMRDMEKRLIIVGVFAWLATHVVVNVASMTQLIPLTGITLPLLSFGGTSMLFVAGVLGLTFGLSCYTEREKVILNDGAGKNRRMR